jgi:uncharacterized membrane protein
MSIFAYRLFSLILLIILLYLLYYIILLLNIWPKNSRITKWPKFFTICRALVRCIGKFNKSIHLVYKIVISVHDFPGSNQEKINSYWAEIEADYFNTVKQLDPSLLSEERHTEGALEYVRMLKFFEVVNSFKISTFYLDLISKHIKTTIYYVDAKEQKMARNVKTFFFGTIGLIMIIFVLSFVFSYIYHKKVDAKSRKNVTKKVQKSIELLKNQNYSGVLS